MAVLFRKSIINLELFKLWTPNKYHLVPYGHTNHLIPNLNSLDDAERKYHRKSLSLTKNGLKSCVKLKVIFPQWDFPELLICYRANFFVLEIVEIVCFAISITSNHKMIGLYTANFF